MLIGAHIIVRGMVQGVGFRYFVYDRAIRLGLNGIVRNLFTGSVEIQVEGERSLIEELIKEVKNGPTAARVNDLKIAWTKPNQQFVSFKIQ